MSLYRDLVERCNEEGRVEGNDTWCTSLLALKPFVEEVERRLTDLEERSVSIGRFEAEMENVLTLVDRIEVLEGSRGTVELRTPKDRIQADVETNACQTIIAALENCPGVESKQRVLNYAIHRTGFKVVELQRTLNADTP